MKRSIVIDLLVESNDIKRQVIDSIRLYRAACRKAYSMAAIAEMAGAEIDLSNGVKIKPNTEATKQILSDTFQIQGKKGHLYELRKWLPELHPSWKYIVPESVQRAVSERWIAPDPEFPKAKRGYLTLNGARAFANFRRRGIELKHTVPKLEPHGFRAKWDFEIGEVKFRFAKMDSSRHYIWKNIVSGSGGWKLGTIYLKEDDGKLVAVISYTCPDKPAELNTDKTMYVEFSSDPQNMITCYTDKRWSGEVISTVGTIDWLKEMEAIYKRYTGQIASYDRRLSRKHRQRLNQRVSKYTQRRKNGEKDHNHMWTRRITQFAQRKGAGDVVVIDVPEKVLGDYPWQWHQFSMFLKYKIEEIGGSVRHVKVEKMQELSQAV